MPSNWYHVWWWHPGTNTLQEHELRAPTKKRIQCYFASSSHDSYAVQTEYQDAVRGILTVYILWNHAAW